MHSVNVRAGTRSFLNIFCKSCIIVQVKQLVTFVTVWYNHVCVADLF